MNTYCGFQTRQNKIKWGIFFAFITLGFILFFSYIGEYSNCYKRYKVEDYYTYNGYQTYYVQRDNSSECYEKYGALVWLAVICWIICSIPFYMMCCCTKKPSQLRLAWAELHTHQNQNYNYGNLAPQNQGNPIYVAAPTQNTEVAMPVQPSHQNVHQNVPSQQDQKTSLFDGLQTSNNV